MATVASPAHPHSPAPHAIPGGGDGDAVETPAAPRGNTLFKWQIGATLVGGTLLLCSVVAQLLWSKELYPAIPAALAMLMLGAPLVYAAVQDLLKGEAGMNALVALAVIGAAATGKYQESAAIAFFMIVSGLIEKRTAIGAEASIESLIKLSPTKAARLREGGGEEMVEAKVLRPGDLVRVRPGDNIPADGRVVTGTSTINLTGVIDVEVTKAGADTLLGRVKDLILQAEKTKTPIMRLVDQYAAWYTPTVLMLVGVVLFFALRSDPDTAFDRAIAMLVIACPSALILATPTAMVAGLSAAARLGVLIKSVVTLEAARNLTAIVFDKTGTLTTGILQVTRLAPQPGVEPGDLLRLAACAEQDSRHPVARAVTEMARKAKLKLVRPTEFEEVAGKGVRTEIDGRKVMVGRGTWLADKGNGLSGTGVAAINEIQASSEADGLSVLYVVRDGELAGWIGLEDNARPEAAEAVDRLRDLGLKRLVILTGDRRSVAKRVAEQMHFSEYKAEVLPHEKLEMVDELKAKGHRVAVIGDGVNDAPALAAGDISIAMGAAGSDVAIHSASIALMNSNLNRVPFLIELSRRTIAVIRQNMIIGGLFILVFMSLAGAGYVTPVWAAFLHIVSGLIVIFNSARLVRSGEEIEQAEADRLAEIARRKARTARIAAAAT